jgi:ABC-2 type transport system ATP-binding protein
MIEISGLSYAYGAKRALQDVSFQVEAGQFTGLLGPNGAGKSTIFSLLCRLFIARQGRIIIAGHDLQQAPRKALSQMGLVFQQTTLDLDLSVRQNLRYFAGLQGVAGRERDRRIETALDRLAMRARAGERARDLNGGHRRRCEIARALLHDPKVLLLDEPTVGLDAESRSAITQHVHDLARDQGISVLWATHLTDELQDRDPLILLHKGSVQTTGTVQDLRGSQSLKDWFLTQTRAEAA